MSFMSEQENYDPEETIIIISETKLKQLLDFTFIQGAHSSDNWSGQRDTQWSNVDQDMAEYVSSVIQDIKEELNNQTNEKEDI